MIQLLPIFFILAFGSTLVAQNNSYKADINQLFELKIDSIEQKITINKRDTDTVYYLHFQVKNTSNDTLNYITNTCFYYNHYSLAVGNLELDLNPKGGCLFNSDNIYKLTPNESFSESQWITAFNLNKLKTGVWSITLSVPLIKNNSTIYRVDGTEFIENKQYLRYEGQTKIIKAVVDNRKRKNKMFIFD